LCLSAFSNIGTQKGKFVSGCTLDTSTQNMILAILRPRERQMVTNS
jgi:hypothetical protein